MALYAIKPKQRGRKCDWCGALSTVRGYGWGKTACHEHRQQLEAWDRIESAPDYSDAAFYGGF